MRTVRLMSSIGMRPAELIRLTVDSLKHTDCGKPYIEAPTRKSNGQMIVRIPLHDETLEIWNDRLPGQHLILTRPDGEFWDEEHLSKTFAKRLNATGLHSGLNGRLGLKKKGQPAGTPEHLTLYDLRGTAVTYLRHKGFGLDAIALHMVWTKAFAAQMLDIYMSEDPAMVGLMFEKLQEKKNGSISRPAMLESAEVQ